MVDWRITFYSYSLVFSAAFSLVVFWIIWQRRSKPGALPLSLLMLAAAEWSCTIALEATAITIEEKILWSQLSYIGIVSTVPLFFLFALEYSSNSKRIYPVVKIAIWIIPTIILGLTFTNHLHYLIWSGFEFLPNSTILIYHHGIAFWIHIAFLYTLLSISAGILIWSAIRNRHLYRMQSITILVSIPIPIIWNILYIAGFSPITGVDLTPAAFSLAGLLLGWGIYRIKLFDIAPVERDTIIENLLDGIIILDPDYRVIDLNSAAATLAHINPGNAYGEVIHLLCPALVNQVFPQNFEEDQCYEILYGNDPPRNLEIRLRKLHGRKEDHTGYSIIIRDITSKKSAELALRESEERNQTLLEKSALPVILLSPDSFSVQYANQRLYVLLDQTDLEFSGKKILDFFDRHGEMQRILKLTKKNNFLNDYEAPMTTSTGRKIWVLISANYTQFGGREALFLSFNDITARKLVEEAEKQQRIFSEALRDSVAALNSTLDFDEVLDRILSSLGKVIPHTTANIMLVDETGSARVVRARGYEVVELEKIYSRMNMHVSETPNLLKMALSGSPLVIPDTRNEPGWVDIDGVDWIKSYIGAPIHVKGQVVGYINLDSTRYGAFDRSQAERLQIFADQAAIAIENARMYEKVEQMAIVDTLTGLYNRRHFFELSEREVERYKRYKSPLSLIMLDLDYFKKVNDQFGHHSGDMVLQELSKIFASSLRKMDIPGRIGGEEFVVLLPETELDQAIFVAERLRKKIENTTFEGDCQKFNVTASMGVVSMKEEIIDLQMLISIADKLMYQAKSAGRNQLMSMMGSFSDNNPINNSEH